MQNPTVQGSSLGQPVRILRWLLLATMLFIALSYIVKTLHWPLLLDSPVMHYVVYLMRHGARPYLDITDNNMPGAYYVEAFAMRVFGGSDLSWRLYDFALLGVMTLALAAIARPYDWLAGLVAGGLFISLHGPEGPSFAVEREQVITVLLVLGYALLFAAVRRKQAAWMFAFGVSTALAASIKPTYVLMPFALLLLAAWQLRKRDLRVGPYVLYAVAGLIVVFAYDLYFLLRYHALHGFFFIFRHVLPAYSGVRRVAFIHLVTSWDRGVLLLLLLAFALRLWRSRNGSGWTWEQWAIALGAGFALLSYFAQGKGFPHHRYPALVFLLLLAAIELLQSLRSREGVWLAWSMAALMLLWMVPRNARALERVRPENTFTTSLESDLQQLGGSPSLNGKVQCFDMVYGCLNALYHLDLMENTAFTGDMLLFSDPPTAATDYYRDKFRALAAQHPAEVLVISNESLEYGNGYGKLARWPEFDQSLRANYTLRAERSFAMREGGPLPPGDHSPAAHDSYRIYVRNNSPLLAVALQ